MKNLIKKLSVVIIFCSLFTIFNQTQCMDPVEMLFFGAREDSIEHINQALNAGVDVNAQNENGSTALMIAVGGANDNIMKRLLEVGANPNIQNYQGNTALMWAAANASEEEVNVLLNAGADINLENENGKTAIDSAISRQVALGLSRNLAVEKILKDAQERRRVLVKKEITESTDLFPDLAEIISEYVVCSKPQKKEVE